MCRRKFIEYLGAGLLGTAMSDRVLLIPAKAVAPVLVAVAVVNTALSVARLFAGSGSGLGDLLRQQVEMLKAMSKQLENIEKGIIEILNNLDEIKQLIGELPQAVVQETQRAKIAGVLARFDQRLRTYGTDIDEGGIAYAQKHNVPAFETIINDVYKSVAILRGYHVAGAIPIICAASFAHFEAMILANYRKSVMLPVVEMYVDWLTLMGKLLSTEIEDKEKQYHSLIETVRFDETYDCSLMPVVGDRARPVPTVYGKFKTVRVTTDNQVLDPQIQEAADQMIALRVMPPDQRPSRVFLRETDISGPTKAVKMGNKVIHPNGKSETWFRDMATNPCSSANTTRQQLIDSSSEQLYQVSLQLMSRRALLHAVTSTLSKLSQRKATIENFRERVV